MADCDLVVASLGEDGFAVVEDVAAEVFGLHLGDRTKLLTTLQKLNINGSTRMIRRTDAYLFLENYAVFCRDVIVLILQRLALHYFLEGEGLLVGKGVDDDLAFVRIVRHDTFDSQRVSIAIVLQWLVVAQIHVVEYNNFLSLSVVLLRPFDNWATINDLKSHVVEQVPVRWSVDFEVHNGVIFGHAEFVLAKDLVLVGLKGQVLGGDLL